jgi:hypothetical protein
VSQSYILFFISAMCLMVVDSRCSAESSLKQLRTLALGGARDHSGISDNQLRLNSENGDSENNENFIITKLCRRVLNIITVFWF